jgi:deazaflavin-dependent oxidoreductase (nitroreductase family)
MAMSAHSPGQTLRFLFRLPTLLYRWRCGWLLGRRFLLLIHTGRRSGLRRETVLEVIEYRGDGPEAVVMSAFGPNSGWLRNIEAGPDPVVVIGSQRFIATHRRLGTAEAVAVLLRYQRRNWLAAPLIRLVLSRLVGWRFAGSPADCRRLADELPLIGFRRAPAVHADASLCR